MRRAPDHGRSCLGLILRNRCMDAREIEFDRRSFPYFAVYFDMPARLFRKTVDLGQTEAGTVSDVLCREERIEGLRQHLRGHPASTIGNGDHHVLAGHHLDLTHGIAFIEIDVRGFDSEFATPGHRITCVNRQVDDRHFKLVGVDVSAP